MLKQKHERIYTMVWCLQSCTTIISALLAKYAWEGRGFVYCLLCCFLRSCKGKETLHKSERNSWIFQQCSFLKKLAGYCFSGVQQPGKWPHPVLSHMALGRCCWRQRGQHRAELQGTTPGLHHHVPCISLATAADPEAAFPEGTPLPTPPFPKAPQLSMGSPTAVSSAFPANKNSIQIPNKELSIHLYVRRAPCAREFAATHQVSLFL